MAIVGNFKNHLDQCWQAVHFFHLRHHIHVFFISFHFIFTHLHLCAFVCSVLASWPVWRRMFLSHKNTTGTNTPLWWQSPAQLWARQLRRSRWSAVTGAKGAAAPPSTVWKLMPNRSRLTEVTAASVLTAVSWERRGSGLPGAVESSHLASAAQGPRSRTPPPRKRRGARSGAGAKRRLAECAAAAGAAKRGMSQPRVRKGKTKQRLWSCSLWAQMKGRRTNPWWRIEEALRSGTAAGVWRRETAVVPRERAQRAERRATSHTAKKAAPHWQRTPRSSSPSDTRRRGQEAGTCQCPHHRITVVWMEAPCSRSLKTLSWRSAGQCVFMSLKYECGCVHESSVSFKFSLYKPG